MIGINDERPGRRSEQRSAEEAGFHAPLLRNRSKLRLALPEERNSKRLENPRRSGCADGLIMAYRRDERWRAYLERYAGETISILDLLHIWTEIITAEDLQRGQGPSVWSTIAVSEEVNHGKQA